MSDRLESFRIRENVGLERCRIREVSLYINTYLRMYV